MRINSYPKVYAIGHPAVAELFDGPVLVEEKVDGSQFSFGVIDGELRFRSRNQEVHPGAAQMFDAAVASVQERADKLKPGLIYRGEYLAKPKHNTIAYDRTPEGLIVIWDISAGEHDYDTDYKVKAHEARRIGFEVAPLLFSGFVRSADELRALLDRDSFLGGSKIEGVVVKNYARFGKDGKFLAGKYVSEAFKETNKVDFRSRNPKSGDILDVLGEMVRNEARWRKAVERLRDDGKLEHSPRDIGVLLKEVQADMLEECEEEVKARLWAWARGQLTRKCVAGFPEWYKERLLESQFGGEA